MGDIEFGNGTFGRKKSERTESWLREIGLLDKVGRGKKSEERSPHCQEEPRKVSRDTSDSESGLAKKMPGVVVMPPANVATKASGSISASNSDKENVCGFASS